MCTCMRVCLCLSACGVVYEYECTGAHTWRRSRVQASSSSMLYNLLPWDIVMLLKTRSQHQDIAKLKCNNGWAIFSASHRRRMKMALIIGSVVSSYQVRKWLKVEFWSYFYDHGKSWSSYEFVIRQLTHRETSYSQSILRTMEAILQWVINKIIEEQPVKNVDF